MNERFQERAADIEDREATVEQKEDTFAPEQHEEAPFIEDREQKWYDKIYGIDSSAALKKQRFGGIFPVGFKDILR